MPFQIHRFGNPHSVTHSYGWDAEEAVEQARQHVANVLNSTDKREIICHYDKTFLIYNFYTGDEILRIENIEDIWLGVGDTLNDNPVKRKVRKDLDYTVGVDSDGNILLINM